MGKTILIVDPDAELRSVMADYLTLQGFDCVVSGSVDGLAECISSGCMPSILIIDPFLGPGAGPALMQKIRSGEAPFGQLRSVKIILHIAAASMPEAHLVKPARLEELFAEVQKMLPGMD